MNNDLYFEPHMSGASVGQIRKKSNLIIRVLNFFRAYPLSQALIKDMLHSQYH